MRNAYTRGREDCYQDMCENAAFSSIGGLAKRTAPIAPSYIDEKDRRDYIQGYEHMALELYGADWRTCKFSWRPAMTINKEDK